MNYPAHTSKKQIQVPQQVQMDHRNFQRWMNNNFVSKDNPVVLHNSFRNLADPLSFIKDDRIAYLQQQTEILKEKRMSQRQAIVDMNKATYEKVLSRTKVDYRFGSSFVSKNTLNSNNIQQSQKQLQKGKQQNINFQRDSKQLSREFVYGNNKLQMDAQNKQKPLTVDVIRQIDQKDWNQKYKDVQFFDVLDKFSQQGQKFPSVYNDISDNYEMDQILKGLKFPFIDKDSYYTQKSQQYLFKADQQLDIWRKQKNKNENDDNQIIEHQTAMKRCQNFNLSQPSFMHLLDYASGKLESKVLSRYFEIKIKLESQMKMNQNEDQNLQKDYKRKKQEYQDLKLNKARDKNQSIKVKGEQKEMQTNDQLEDKSFDSYFEQSANDIMIKIRQLNQVKDQILNKKENDSVKNTMMINACHQVKGLLFKLLALIVKNESFVNYDELIQVEDTGIAERKILEIIYQYFDQIKHYEVDGIEKKKIMETYLQQRQKNQKMFQLIGRIYQKDNKQKKAKILTPKSKTSSTVNMGKRK